MIYLRFYIHFIIKDLIYCTLHYSVALEVLNDTESTYIVQDSFLSLYRWGIISVFGSDVTMVSDWFSIFQHYTLITLQSLI